VSIDVRRACAHLGPTYHVGVDAGIVFRRGTADDARDCHRLLFEAVTDFERQHGTPLEGTEEAWWAGQEPFQRYLAAGAAEWWVAQDGDSGPLLGYGRSIDNGGLFELTEFFVKPGHQAKGIGRQLIERAFPDRPGATRCIIATRDVRALARYYATGLAIRFPIFEISGPTRPAAPPADLEVRRVDGEADVATVRELELTLRGFERSVPQLRTLLEVREAYLYHRGAAAIGFSFVSPGGIGPIGAVEPIDQPAILGHIEGRLHALGVTEMELGVAGLNGHAIRHLLGRGYRFDPFMSFLLSDRPFGQFDRFIGFYPPLFL
jgi:GNAT superfamily N-acetyltransferase